MIRKYWHLALRSHKQLNRHQIIVPKLSPEVTLGPSFSCHIVPEVLFTL
jgi:hypothetical protein